MNGSEKPFGSPLIKFVVVIRILMKKSILCLIYLLAFGLSHAAGDRVIRIGNDLFSYVIGTEGDRIRPVSYYDLKNDRELLSGSVSVPYFEFELDGGTVSSEQPVWKFVESVSRRLQNGGIETTSLFRGSGCVEGLELKLDHQCFPHSALVRERLRLKASPSKSFCFRNRNGKNHFVFPRYRFRIHADSIQELRMGTFDKEIIRNFDPMRTRDDRPVPNLSGCHMFHTDCIVYSSNYGKELWLKGPFSVIYAGSTKLVTSYEHASQDRAIMRGDKCGTGLWSASGRTTAPSDDDYWFIGTHITQDAGESVVSQQIRRGGYLDGEAIPADGYYETVWSTMNFMPVDADHLAAIRHYLSEQITEHALSRRAEYYYNTWGLQREASSEGSELREIFNEKRILEEIDCAAELNVDLIVFDDGWQEAIGVWSPNKKRFPNGLGRLIDRIRAHGMIPGAWISLMGIDSTSTRYREHPEWVVRDADGHPVSAQWRQPAFDLVGDFYRLIKQDHIRLIDLGFRFFKWDAINTFHSYLPNLGHGTDAHSEKERIDRYNYLLPFYVTRLMRELREYEPEVVIELDLTEPERAMVGLMPLQEGKFFWMNNGGSGYRDYSRMRTKSMRSVICRNGDLLPPEVFTYAQYPHDVPPCYAQRYNVNTALVAGHGLWGNLKRMSSEERRRVGSEIAKSKRVMPWIRGKTLHRQGTIGSSPEIYCQVDEKHAFGQVVGFSAAAGEYDCCVKVDSRCLAGVLNHAYRLEGDAILFEFQFTMPDDTREAFIIGNEGCGVTVLSATGWLEDIRFRDDSLVIVSGAEGVLRLRLPEHFAGLTVDRPYRRAGNVITLNYGERDTLHVRWERDKRYNNSLP